MVSTVIKFDPELALTHLAAFIIPGTIGAVIMWFYFPDTLGKPLEQTAALFGDQDEVAAYMRDITIDASDESSTEKAEQQTMTIEKVD